MTYHSSAFGCQCISRMAPGSISRWPAAMVLEIGKFLLSTMRALPPLPSCAGVSSMWWVYWCFDFLNAGGFSSSMLLGIEPESTSANALRTLNNNLSTNLGKCTCPSRGCSRRSREADGSSLPQPLWECARSTRSVGRWNPRRSHRCRTPAGTLCHSRPSPEVSEGGRMGSTTSRPPSSRQ